jgi:hypothetical protein
VRLNENLVRQVEDVVSSGYVDSLTNLVSKCLELGLKYSFYMWDRGVWHFHGIRVGALSKKSFEIIFKHADDPYKAGREVGKGFKNYIKYSFKKDSIKRKDWNAMLREVEPITGWGNYVLTNDIITVASPLPPRDFLRGFLESLLGVRLKMASDEPLQFQILGG